MEQTSDFDKLYQAYGEITSAFGSFENLLEAFGLLHMPAAQLYGIIFGCITFTLTITTVILLLIYGGTFKRIAEQTGTGDGSVRHPHKARTERALLMEHLLEARERMIQHYPKPILVGVTGFSSLTTLLLNVHSRVVGKNEHTADASFRDEKKETGDEVVHREIPDGYQQNYTAAYRKCQDMPGGGPLSGRPESRFEAYARAFSGCGNHTNLSYRRSYGRMYEAISCQNHKTDDKYTALFKTRPQDIIGKFVRLEALEAERHLDSLFELSSGFADAESKSFDPEIIWGFQEDGPFENRQEMRSSFVFRRKINEAAFAIVNNVTDKIVGAIILTNDTPQNLSIQLQPAIMRPSKEGSEEQQEASFLLIDKLFALGYRRIQIAIDSQDGPSRKLALRLGFTMEGVLYKHIIQKDSSRDSNIYGLLNSDWLKGARPALYQKLHGATAARSDSTNRKNEEETDEQNRVLAEKKAEEEALKDKNL